MGAEIASQSLLFIPNGPYELPESLISFLWERDLAAFLCKNHHLPPRPEEARNTLGVRVCPGSA